MKYSPSPIIKSFRDTRENVFKKNLFPFGDTQYRRLKVLKIPRFLIKFVFLNPNILLFQGQITSSDTEPHRFLNFRL